jgi:hypothetical protein
MSRFSSEVESDDVGASLLIERLPDGWDGSAVPTSFGPLTMDSEFLCDNLRPSADFGEGGINT